MLPVGFLTRGETEGGFLFSFTKLETSITSPLTPSGAAEITDKIKNCIEDAYDLLQIAYDQKAWDALGYDSWKDYVETEFKMTKQRSYQLLGYNSVCKLLKQKEKGGESTVVDSLTERALRPLASVPPEKQSAVFADAIASSPNGIPTGKEIKAAVEKVKPPKKAPKSSKPILPKVEKEDEGDHDEDNAKEMARELVELDKENRELKRLNASLSASDAGKEIATIRKDFQSVCGRVNQLLAENKEMEKTIKYYAGILAKCRKLLQCENPGIVAAITAILQEAKDGTF